MSTQPTCLFTDKVLTSETKVEHTIPESVGGRIKTRLVTSSEFNEYAGIRTDYAIKAIYEPMLNRLSPLLPRSSQAGKMPVEIPGEQNGFVMENGRLSLQSPVIERDAKNRPISIKASDRKPIDRIAKSLGKDPQSLQVSYEPATDAHVYLKRTPILCRDVELAALKAILTTFDALLSTSAFPFTRSPECGDARVLLRRAVMDNYIETDILNKISLGIQYEKIGVYRSIRSKLGVPLSPFEHVMYVSSNLPTRTLDVVWNVFGIDPFGFRLSSNWNGDSFALAVVNPILANSSASDVVPFAPPEESLCRPTERRSQPQYATEDDMLNTLYLVSSERHRSVSEAIQLVEMSADAHVTECMMESSSLASGTERSAQSQITKRILNMFGRKQDDVDFRSSIAALVSDAVSRHPEISGIHDLSIASNSEVEPTLVVYRQCFTDAIAVHGSPGDAFTNKIVISIDPSDERLLGKLPPMQ